MGDEVHQNDDDYTTEYINDRTGTDHHDGGRADNDHGARVRIDHYIGHNRTRPDHHHHHTDHDLIIRHAHDFRGFVGHDHATDPGCDNPDCRS